MPSYIKVYNIKVKYSFLKYFLNDFNLQWAIFALKMQFLPEVKELKEVKIWVSWTQQVIELNSNMFQYSKFSQLCLTKVGELMQCNLWMVVQSHESLEGEIESFWGRNGISICHEKTTPFTGMLRNVDTMHTYTATEKHKTLILINLVEGILWLPHWTCGTLRLKGIWELCMWNNHYVRRMLKP